MNPLTGNVADEITRALRFSVRFVPLVPPEIFSSPLTMVYAEASTPALPVLRFELNVCDELGTIPPSAVTSEFNVAVDPLDETLLTSRYAVNPDAAARL